MGEEELRLKARIIEMSQFENSFNLMMTPFKLEREREQIDTEGFNHVSRDPISIMLSPTEEFLFLLDFLTIFIVNKLRRLN